MDGWTVLQNLKEQFETAGIPVIMLTIAEDHNCGYPLAVDEYVVHARTKAQ